MSRIPYKGFTKDAATAALEHLASLAYLNITIEPQIVAVERHCHKYPKTIEAIAFKIRYSPNWFCWIGVRSDLHTVTWAD